MKPLFGPEGRAALGAVARPGTLVALDYDGTLAPICATPSQAYMRPQTQGLLSKVCRRYPVLVLTGRARGDAQRLLAAVGPLEVIGSHGLETFGTPSTRFSERVARWRERLRERLGALKGVDIEDKRLSLAVHYRHAPDAGSALRQIEETLAELPGGRIVAGKMVVNVVPAEAPDKGAALLAACRRAGGGPALYVGDDATDEDAFRLAQPGEILTVRIGPDEGSAAQFFLPDQSQIDDLLRALLGDPSPI